MATFSMSTLSIGSDEVKGYCCSTCEEQSFEIDADFYCETCLKFYCNKCLHHHAQLFKKHSPYGRNKMNKWPVSKKVEDFLLKCAAHKDETLKMFCDDHNQLCCTNCFFLEHRQCSKVTLISKSVKKAKTADLQRLSAKLQDILDQMKSLHKKQEASIQSVQGSYDEQLQLVRETRRKINVAFDRLETDTLNEMKAKLKSLHASLKADIENCTRLQNDLKRLHEAIQDINDKSKQELSFIARKKCSDIIQQSESFLKEKSVQVKVSIAFKPNSEIVQYMSTLSGLGKIEQSTQTLHVQGNPDQVLTQNGKSVHNVKISSDSSTCSITAICVLSDGQFLVADNWNKKVKLLSLQYKVVSHWDVTATPWDVCQVTPNEVAVTVCENETHEVQFITVNTGNLVPSRKFQLQHSCAGIAHHQGELYITSRTALYKYSLDGKLAKKVYEDISGDDTVSRCAVSSTGDKLYIINPLKTCSSPLPWMEQCWLHLMTLNYGAHMMYMYRLQARCWSVDGLAIYCRWTLREKEAGHFGYMEGRVMGSVSVCYSSNTSSIIVGQYDNNEILVLKVE